MEESHVSVIALRKGEDRFIFIFDDVRRRELLYILGKFAMNEDLNFTWHDAAMLNKKMKELVGNFNRF